MNLGQIFNQADLPESTGGFEPIPEGWYQAQIAKAELKDTKDGTGQYINLQFSITGPSYEGRVIFGMLNIKNKSQQAEEIGRQQLGEVMRALGLARVQDTDELVGGRIQIKVGVQPAKDGYEARNNVKSYKAIEGSPAPGTVAQSKAISPPWVKK